MSPSASVVLSLWILVIVATTSASQVCLVNPLKWQQSRVLSTLSQNYNTQSFFANAEHFKFDEAQDIKNAKIKCDLIIVTGSSGTKGVKDETTREWTAWDKITLALQGPIVWETCQCDPIVKQKNPTTIFCHKAVIIPRLLDNKYSLLSVPSTYWKLPVGEDVPANDCFNLIRKALSEKDQKEQEELKKKNQNYQIVQKKFSIADVMTAARNDEELLLPCRQSLKVKDDSKDKPKWNAAKNDLIDRIQNEKILRETPNYLDEVSDRMLLMNVKSKIFESALFAAVTAIKPILITDFLVEKSQVLLATREVVDGVITLKKKAVDVWDGVVTAETIQKAPRLPIQLFDV